ncbi:MAG: hypothetical protein SAK29_34770 [Scytonema sp. PMC 1069.18]|nr:hypothetical protein [Scytonema sp. PMC 1069.18]MEC4883186.1 hypothetical protein [Scytonema sp. PMC 1070.18]
MSNNGTKPESINLSPELQAIASVVHDAATICQGDTLALLALLRQLEQLHREIRDGAFQQSLPDNRQALYSLLRNIEAKGGWPYIERMKLQSFLSYLQQDTDAENSTELRSEELEVGN